MKLFPNARFVSIISNGVAILLPFALYAAGFYDPPDTDRYVCGLYILGPLFFTLMLVGALGLLGLAAAAIRYRNQARPRNWKHNLELLACAIPLCLVVVAVVIFFTA